MPRWGMNWTADGDVDDAKRIETEERLAALKEKQRPEAEPPKKKPRLQAALPRAGPIGVPRAGPIGASRPQAGPIGARRKSSRHL